MKFDKIITLFLEKSKTTRNLVKDSESKRKKRANNVKILSLKKYTPTNSPTDKPLLKGWKYYDFEVESQEKIQGRNHQGYVVLDQNNNVKDVYCSCADFQFLWRYALSNADMASSVVYDKYQDIEDHAPYTGDASDITNPNYERKLCKHLISIFKKVKI